MSKYFEHDKKYDPEFEYSTELDHILNTMADYGTFKGSKKTLDILWRMFSKSEYSTDFLDPCDDHFIARFMDWLDNYEEDI